MMNHSAHEHVTSVNDVSYCNPPDLEPKIALPAPRLSEPYGLS